MANKQDYSRFAQVDYCIQQYYARVMYGSVKRNYESIQKTAKKEYGSYLANRGNAFTPVSAQIAGANLDAQSTHLWDRTSTDKMVAGLQGQWNKNTQLKEDIGKLKTSFAHDLFRLHKLPLDVDQMSKKQREESIQLINYANDYVDKRLESLMVNQLAKYHVPKGSAEYIMKESYNSSFPVFLSKLIEKIKVGPFDFSGGAYKSKYDDAAEDQASKLYKPKNWEKAAAVGGSMLIDMPMGGVGFGSVTKGAINLVGKGVTKLATGTAKTLISRSGNKASKVADLLITHPFSSVAQDFGVRFGLSRIQGDDSPDDKKVFGDEHASEKIKGMSSRYYKTGTEYISNINSSLHKKIRVAKPDFNLQCKLTGNQLLKDAKGYSYTLQKSITKYFDHQAIPYNSNAHIPGWMLLKSSKQCRAFAASFYAIAKQMSEKRIDSVKVSGGRKMSLKEVAQRAYDYSRAATYIDRKTWTRKAEQERISRPRYTRGANKQHSMKQSSVVQENNMNVEPSATYTQSPSVSQPTTVNQEGYSLDSPELSGWGSALENQGLGNFGNTGHSLGYTLAMLPDMLIGMFTGKTPNFRLEDNLMPLGFIMFGAFMRRRNPGLAMLMMALGAGVMVKHASHAEYSEDKKESLKKKQYKTYENEPLNPRIKNPVLKGKSLLCEIDGDPLVITINGDAPLYCYEQGLLPLNVLANDVLKKYDEKYNTISQQYNRQIQDDEERSQNLLLR